MSDPQPEQTETGDDITVGNIENSKAIAVGRGATAVYHEGLTTEQAAALMVELQRIDQPKVWDGRIPYLGLTAFQESDAQFFFGRESLVDDLLARVQTARFIVIAGPSGSGKSSVAKAGLFHALRNGRLERSSTWLLAAMQPKGDPIKQLALAVERLAKRPGAGDHLRQNGTENPLALYEQIETLLTDDRRQRCVLLVDQFEETFTQTKNEAERVAFINLLATAARVEAGRTIILLSLRSDFVSHCARYPELRTLMSQQFQLVGAMAPPDLAKAITLPALEVGAKIDPELVSRIMADMKGEPGALPLMSFVLRDLFEAENSAKDQSVVLTLTGYLVRGGIESALEQHANQVFAAFTDEQKTLARGIFSKLIEVGEGRADTRRTVAFSDLIPAGTDPEAVEAVVAALAAEGVRLLTTDAVATDDETTQGNLTCATVTIAHEKLIDAWPWLRQLVDDNRDMIALQNQLHTDAREWARKADIGYLYRGGRLIQVEEQLTALTPSLNTLSQAFIQTSLDQRQKEIDEKEIQQRRQLEQAQELTIAEQKRSALFLRASIGGGILALFLFGALILAGIQTNRANENLNISKVRGTEAANEANIARTAEAIAIVTGRQALGLSLAAQAPRLAIDQEGQDDELAILLALEAQRLNNETGNKINKVVDNALRSLLTQNYYSNILKGNNSRINATAFSPNGEFIAFTDNNDAIWYWNISSPYNEPIALNMYLEGEDILAFSSDGNTLASGNKNGIVRLWDMRNPSSDPIILKDNASTISAISFDTAGSKLAIGTTGGQLLIWDISNSSDTPKLMFILQGHSGGFNNSVNSVTFTSDGQTLASGSMDGTVKLWQVASPNADPIVWELPEKAWVWDTVFSPDENSIVVASQDAPLVSPLESSNQPGTVWIWDFSDIDKYPIIFEQNDWAVKSLGLSPDGETLALGSLDGTIRLWNLLNTTSVPVILEGHQGEVNSVLFSPDKSTLFTSSSDGMIRLWNFSSKSVPQIILDDHLGVVFSVDFSPSGETLATASSFSRRMSAINPGNVRQWQVENPTAAPITKEHQGPVFDALYIDEETLASISMVGPIQLWQTTNSSAAAATVLGYSEESRALNSYSSIRTLAVSPNGEILASVSFDGTVMIWDVLNPNSNPITLESYSGDVTSVSFSPNSSSITNLAAGTTNGTVLIWDVTRLEDEPISLGGNKDTIISISFSPYAEYLAVGTTTNKILIWDISDLSNVVTEPFILEGHQGSINSLAFSPNGKILASGSYDRTVRLWQVADIFDFPIPVILEGHDGPINSVAFSPDSTLLATGSADGTSRLWVISLDELARTGCKIVQRNLTWEEWQQFLPTEKNYNQTCPNLPIHPSVPFESRP